MPAPPGPGSSADDGNRQNLFVEADPEYDAFTSPPKDLSSGMDTSAARRPRRGRGLVMPVEGQAKPAPPPPRASPILATRDEARSRL
jgi:hypothetical protein